MTEVLRNMLAVFVGLVVGGALNMAIITASPSLVPPPPGVDVTDAESLNRAIHLFEPRHFAMPFLAHALGTLAGALVAHLIAVTRKASMAYVVGGVFLAGGVAASSMIKAPSWFVALDLLAAYLPMAWLGIQIARRARRS